MTQKWIVGGVPEHFNLPWQLALEQGKFHREGIDLEFREYATGTGAMCADLRAGELHLAVALTEGLLMDMALKRETCLIAPYVSSALNWGVHVAQAGPFQQVAALEGQTFAISRYGSGSHLMAMLWAQQQGWDPQALKFLEVGGLSALEQALTEGKAAAFLWEKFTTLPRVKTGSLRALAKLPTPWPCFMMAARREFVQTQVKTLSRILEIVYAQASHCQQHPEQTIAQVALRFGLTEAEAQDWFEGGPDFEGVHWATQAQLPFEALQLALQTLQQLELISQENYQLSDFIWQPPRATA